MTDTSKFTVTQEMTDAFYSKAEVTSRGTILNLEAAIEATLAAAPGQKAVRVKPLEWENVGDGSFSGNSPIGKYLIFAGTGFSYELWAPVGGRIGVYKRREMAQAAAQADYERRILSAIDFQASDDITALKAENERLREAMELATPKKHILRPIVDDEMEILKRLADGDTIRFSQDGDAAWFTKGDGAFVGNAIISLRSKGYLKRECDDEENYRGMSEYDTISDLGRAALKGGDHE